MAKQPIVILLCIAALLVAGTVQAQTEPDRQPAGSSPAAENEEKSFNLIVGDEGREEIAEEVMEEEEFEPAIQPGTWDLTLTLGYFNMTKTLLAHPAMIYKATDEAFFYGDVQLVNESAFNPMLRLGYTMTDWFALEVQGGVTFSEYQATITNAYSVDPAGGTSPKPVEEVGEFDPERRSVLIFIGNVNAVVYPFNIAGDGKGRWHPYVTAGAGMALYNIDSNYVDDPASGGNVNVGVGIKLVADSLISVRAELLYHAHEIQFEPAQVFDSQDDGTTEIPVYEFDELGNYSRVDSFESQTLSGLTWQIGFSIKL
jgi:hypothetical protein